MMVMISEREGVPIIMLLGTHALHSLVSWRRKGPARFDCRGEQRDPASRRTWWGERALMGRTKTQDEGRVGSKK